MGEREGKATESFGFDHYHYNGTMATVVRLELHRGKGEAKV